MICSPDPVGGSGVGGCVITGVGVGVPLRFSIPSAGPKVFNSPFVFLSVLYKASNAVFSNVRMYPCALSLLIANPSGAFVSLQSNLTFVSLSLIPILNSFVMPSSPETSFPTSLSCALLMAPSGWVTVPLSIIL